MSSKDTICRVCLQEGNIPIYGNEQLDDVSEDLNSLANIKVTQDDTFPKHLCYNCYSLLQSAVELRRTATHSDAVLQGRIVSNYGTVTSESSTESDQLPPDWPDLCCNTEDDDPEEKVESTCDAIQTDVDQIYTKECKEIHKKPFKSKTRNQIKPSPYKNLLLNIDKVDMNIKSESDVNLTPQLQSLQARLVRPTNLEPRSSIQPSSGPGTSVSVNEVIVSKASSNAVKTASDAKVKLVKIKNTTIKKLSTNKTLTIKILSNKEKENVTNKTSKSLIEPVQSLKSRKRPKEPCPICGKVYLSVYIQRHLQFHDEKNNKRQRDPCPVCGKLYLPDYMKSHLEFHNDDSKSHICAVCGKGFKSSVTFYQHKRAHSMRTDNFIYKCSQCSYSHWQRHILRRHEKIHTVQEKPFQCDICQKSFTIKGNLNKHVRTHEGPQFKCNMCEKRYTDQCSLNNHIKVVHTGGIRDQICETCGAAFVTRQKLLKHERKVHKRKLLPLGRTPCYLTPKYQSEENSENKI